MNLGEDMFEYPVRVSWDIGKDRAHNFEVMDDLARCGVFFVTFSGNPFEWEEFNALVKRGAENQIWAMASTSVWDSLTAERINNSEVEAVTLLIESTAVSDQIPFSLFRKPVNVSISLRKVDADLSILDELTKIPLVQRVYIAPYFRFINPPLSEEEKAAYRRLAFKVHELRKTGHSVIIQDPVVCPITEVLYAEGHSTMCPAGTSTVHIAGDLEVHPCPRWKVPCGSLKAQSMKTIWQESEQLKKIRALRLDGLQCPSFSSCLGGCRAIVEKAGLPLEKCDPDCLIGGNHG